MNFGKQLKEGLLTNNPVLVQVLGMCSTMAITTSFFNGLGMGLSVLIILTLSNIIIAAIRKITPNKIRIAMFIVVIACFVTCVDLLLQAFVPALSKALGVFLPLIVVNCIILGRAEAFASKERHSGLRSRRHLPGSGLHGSSDDHVHLPRVLRLRHLRRRHHQRQQGHPHHPRAVSRQDPDAAGGRLPVPCLPDRR
jgi:hypothetical protein